MILAKMSLVGKNGVDRLRAVGVEPSLDDYIALHQLGKQVEGSVGSGPISLLPTPRKIGNAKLWPWSIGSELWFNKRACVWFEGDNETLLYAMGFAMAHSMEPGVLDKLTDPEEAGKAIMAWATHCSATRDELQAAIEATLPPDPTPGKSDKVCPACGQIEPPDPNSLEAMNTPDPLDEDSYINLIERLLRMFPGTTREEWLWCTPQALSLRLLHHANEHEAAIHGIENSGGKWQAVHRFEMALKQIANREKYEAENG